MTNHNTTTSYWTFLLLTVTSVIFEIFILNSFWIYVLVFLLSYNYKSIFNNTVNKHIQKKIKVRHK